MTIPRGATEADVKAAFAAALTRSLGVDPDLVSVEFGRRIRRRVSAVAELTVQNNKSDLADSVLLVFSIQAIVESSPASSAVSATDGWFNEVVAEMALDPRLGADAATVGVQSLHFEVTEVPLVRSDREKPDFVMSFVPFLFGSRNCFSFQKRCSLASLVVLGDSLVSPCRSFVFLCLFVDLTSETRSYTSSETHIDTPSAAGAAIASRAVVATASGAAGVAADGAAAVGPAVASGPCRIRL